MRGEASRKHGGPSQPPLPAFFHLPDLPGLSPSWWRGGCWMGGVPPPLVLLVLTGDITPVLLCSAPCQPCPQRCAGAWKPQELLRLRATGHQWPHDPAKTFWGGLFSILVKTSNDSLEPLCPALSPSPLLGWATVTPGTAPCSQLHHPWTSTPWLKSRSPDRAVPAG